MEGRGYSREKMPGYYEKISRTEKYFLQLSDYVIEQQRKSGDSASRSDFAG